MIQKKLDTYSSDTILNSCNENNHKPLSNSSQIAKSNKPVSSNVPAEHFQPQIRGRRAKTSAVTNTSLHRCPNHISSSKRTQAQKTNETTEMTHFAFVDMQTETNHDTALTLACVGGHASLATLLIKRGANIEHRDKKGFTSLILAATGGHLEACRALIEAGCQVDAQADRTKDTALSLACSGGRKDVKKNIFF